MCIFANEMCDKINGNLLKQIKNMRQVILTVALLAAFAMTAGAQKIDFDFPGRNSSEVTEPNYVPWPVGRVTTDTKTLDNGVKIVITATDGATALASNWSKNTIQKSTKLLGDGVFACHLNNGNYVWITEGRTAVKLTITGLSAGHHSLLAYHNDTDAGQTHPDVEVSVDGEVKVMGVKHSSGAQKLADSGVSFVEFDVVEGQPVVVKYACVPEDGQTYNRTSIMLNGLEFDTNPYRVMETKPANYDYHVAADDGRVDFSWLPADVAVAHKLVYGVDSAAVADAVNYQYEGAANTFTATDFSPLVRYWWRVDEVDADGTVYKGQVMSFQPRRDAFPGAEGYGRYAIGGRGGVVYHVTTLEDNGSDDSPVEGSLRYGIKKVSGPRTIVFDVAGIIALKSRLTCSDPFVTIAGQTAPGHGIMLTTCPFGVATDGITRFLRMRLGHKRLVNRVIPKDNVAAAYGSDYGLYPETTLNGLDGMGMAGNDNAIMDHCSVSWTIDEGFSSRNAKGITLQHTLISEALNEAGHPNYGMGTCHGYAATIGAGQMTQTPGSFHHNLLAHCEGRNWSISGGLDGSGAYDGHHDIFNNVVYNWGTRASDGGTHELNFVNNYYKKGPATTQNYLLSHDFEGTGSGSQSAYVSGNIREETTGTKTTDREGNTYRYTLKNGQTLTWQPWASEPFFPSLATIETAEAAYKNVLSDVGCNQPFFDLHDQRMVTETFRRTTTTRGSRSNKQGLIDSEEDAGCEGFDLGRLGLVEAQREAGWDTDRDGIPDWFENVVGTDPLQANNNDDRNGDYYTDLEEYLNWMAVPHFFLQHGKQLVIDLQPYFAGYKMPDYTLDSPMDNCSDWHLSDDGRQLILYCTNQQLNAVHVTATEDGISLTRRFNFVVNGTFAGITEPAVSQPAPADNAVYNLAGQRLSRPQKGLNIQRNRKFVM